MLISISSSDLDSGRRPIAISDEFSEISILVSEIRRCENKAFPKKRPTYWDFESQPRKRVVVSVWWIWACVDLSLHVGG